MSRPTAIDSRLRAAHFLTLVASGIDGESAAREANLSPWKALRIVTEASFNDVVAAIRDGELGPTVVVVDEPQAEAA